jgi:choline dehydrogenase-like flavoprotein
MAAPWQEENFDAIVVGTGPGGATVARELGRRKKKVLVLEWAIRHFQIPVPNILLGTL